MNANSDKLNQVFSDRLSEFQRRLQEHIGDEAMLREIHAAMKSLLSGDGAAEADVRAILSKRFAEGALRDETFQLVSEMIDAIVTDDVETMSGKPDPTDDAGDPFGETTVIPVETFVPVPDEDRLQVGSVLRDRFLLQERVSGGSMGVVYKALDRRLAEADGVEPWVAIKVLSPKLSRNVNALRAMQQEAAKGRCLSHPNIVRFIDLDRDDDTYFMVMEWLEGRSLASILDDGRSRSIEHDAALDIVRQLARALDYAHRCGVVHADVKPGNIIITPAGGVKLFDFGVARIRQKRHDGEADFDPGVLDAKTPAYSSMQVLTGEDPVPEDDVFSLGCLMYRMIAGYRVFGPRNAAEAADAGMEPQRPQGLSQTEWAALRRALSFSRVTRFATPAEFLSALDGPEQPAAAEPAESSPYLEDEREGGSRWRIVVIVLIIVAAVAVINQSGLLRWLEPGSEQEQTAGSPSAPVPAPVVEAPVPAPVVDGPSPATASGELPSDPVTVVDEPALEEVAEPIDFSTLPPPTLTVTLAAAGSSRNEAVLTMREDSGPATLDLLRETDIGAPLVVKLEEIGFSGNRSPWESGQYELAENGVLRFPPGQERARTVISMPSDPLREPDRQVTLLVRDFDTPGTEFAAITLNLEDDDQRVFEAGLAANTVAFAVSQVSVRERDPAVQIDVLRFKPDDSPLDAEFVVRDVTATVDEDYFVPGATTVSFAPGQRTARILIPLVQDSVPERDEAFILELVGVSPASDSDIFLRIAVMIRDDDS